MASKLEALATDVALLAVAFSVGNPSPKEKTFVVWREKKITSANACRRRIIALNNQIARVAEHALSFCHCAPPPPPPPSLMVNFL